MDTIFGGVETGGTWIVCALGSGPEDILAEEQFRTTSPEETIDRIVGFFADRERPRAAAIGVGSFGPVDLDPRSPTWGNVTTTPKPGWQNTPLASVLQSRLDIPIRFDTDVNAAALGEQRWGAGRGTNALAYLTVGTGIGAGLLYEGRPWHGLIHPEAGHIRIPHDRERDPFAGICPVHGDCWEGLASGEALRERFGKPPDQLPGDHPVWQLEAEYLALGILAIVLVVSPERVVIGGGVLAHHGLLDGVRAEIERLNGGYVGLPDMTGYLVAPELGDRAGVLGAIVLAQM